MNDDFQILIVDDDQSHLYMLQTIFKGWGYRTTGVESGRAALEAAEKRAFDLVLMDIRMEGLDGLETQARLRARQPNLPVIIMTAYSNVDSAIKALKAGAYDYLTKPLDFDLLQKAVGRALEHTSLKAEKEAGLLGSGSSAVLGQSPGLKKVMALVAMVAPTEATVLVTGESGTGKELIARAIHELSLRKDKPLAVINCAALSESLLEAELFGHEKGAFTGADRRRDGRLKSADGGTLLLDEIGEMPLTVQAKLLRALQEGEVQRLGSDAVETVDVRFLASTNRQLEREVKAGRFREDLFYRLNVVNIYLPPLRERQEDLPPLAAGFIRRFARKNHKVVQGLTPEALAVLCAYGWPGNVRELQNVIERAVILMRGEYITPGDLPQSLRERPAPVGGGDEPGGADPARVGFNLEALEKEAVRGALEQSGGNKSQAAKVLGVTRKTLAAKIKKYFDGGGGPD